MTRKFLGLVAVAALFAIVVDTADARRCGKVRRSRNNCCAPVSCAAPAPSCCAPQAVCAPSYGAPTCCDRARRTRRNRCCNTSCAAPSCAPACAAPACAAPACCAPVGGGDYAPAPVETVPEAPPAA